MKRKYYILLLLLGFSVGTVFSQKQLDNPLEQQRREQQRQEQQKEAQRLKAQREKQEREAEEQKRLEDTKKRLEDYNFVGKNTLGSYWIVQKKVSPYQWGIIDKEGNVKVSFTYDQVSMQLKNNYYALRNAQGWDVYNASLSKIASGIADLKEYQ